MACDPVTFNNIDQPIFDALKGKLQGLGYDLQGTSGTIKGPMSIVIDFDWNKDAATLMIHVTEKNFLIPCGKITSELEKAIAACRV